MASSQIEEAVAPAVIPVEAYDNDHDSAYGNSSASSTASLTDSIREYRKVHGRTFQNYKEVEYWGPNDDKQQEHLDIMHHMLTLLLDNKLFLAPLSSNPQKVLDIGTGTGIWAMDFADQFPSAEVLGIDLSESMPKFVPSNCKFEIDDAELDWTFGSNIFDFIHIRYMLGTVGDWTRLYSQAFDATKPGGYIEHFELSVHFECDDGSLSEDNPLRKWGPLQSEAAVKMGKTLDVCDHVKENIEKAGFVDVVEHNFKIPSGPWSSDPKMRQIGQWNLLAMLEDMEGFALYTLTKFMGWSHTEVILWVGEVKRALRDRKTHVYWRANLVYGEKPKAV